MRWGRDRARRWAGRLAVVTTAGVTLAAGLMVTPTSANADEDSALYLVTLRGPGTAAIDGFLPRWLREVGLLSQQDDVLATVGSPEPIYRWTAALSGFAVEITEEQAETLKDLPTVARVERNEVRPLASLADTSVGLAATGPRRGGSGTVIGIIDTGIAPEHPLFAQLRHRTVPNSFVGTCEAAQDWDRADCNGKVVGARWFVEGFGADAVRSATALSPRDIDGHGTQMASIAAGNAGVPVRVGGERLGRFGGNAPQAQIAVYKACWSAPDPQNDGCATADLVSAIDQATADGVDVLSLSVGGPAEIDTVELALLGATEADIVVAAAAGNGADLAAAHPSPWVTTVGGRTGDNRRGQVRLPSGRRFTGAMLSQRQIGALRVVLGAKVAATGVLRSDARACIPGSLDAARVAGAIVVCQRGRVGRVDKSEAVALADGSGMVLVNQRRDSVDADVHSVPTVHLAANPGRDLVRWVARHPAGRIRLDPRGLVQRRPQVARWSATGDVTAGVIKPDLLAPATGLLGAVPASSGPSWGFVNGTSAATAYTAGLAATLLGRRGWTPAEVRSALVTTAAPVRGTTLLHTGAGRVRADLAAHPGLAYLIEVTEYRAWLEGRRTHLNTPSVLLVGGALVARRTITNTNTGKRRLYFSSSAIGFRRNVQVTPAAVRLGPGESATFRIRVSSLGGGSRLDDGYVLWRGATGTVTRLPVVIAR